jgi:arabinose-5-phosphate isomerase
VHAAEAVHGDLGRIRQGDCAIVLSNSGETAEIVGLLPALSEMEIPVIGITSRPSSRLGQEADVVLELGTTEEACPLGLAPSTSTTAMLALGDALALVVSQLRGFTHADFARFHPGGSLGRRLSKVNEVMRPLDQCCVAKDTDTLREIYIQSRRPRRRSGAILLVDPSGRLSGIFTDSDLARLFERKRDGLIDQPIREVMTATPITVAVDAMLMDAVKTLATRKISELPIVDPLGHPLGLIDITDVLGLLPHEVQEQNSTDRQNNTPGSQDAEDHMSSRAA